MYKHSVIFTNCPYLKPEKGDDGWNLDMCSEQCGPAAMVYRHQRFDRSKSAEMDKNCADFVQTVGDDFLWELNDGKQLLLVNYKRTLIVSFMR